MLDSHISAAAVEAEGSVIQGMASVIDGDTMEIHGSRIRLHGIDAAESVTTRFAPRPFFIDRR